MDLKKKIKEYNGQQNDLTWFKIVTVQALEAVDKCHLCLWAISYYIPVAFVLTLFH